MSKRGRGGRPKKYTEKWVYQFAIPKIRKVISEMNISNIFMYHTRAALSDELNTYQDMLTQLEKQYPEFSIAIKEWHTKASRLYDAFANHPTSRLNAGIYIFTKANTSKWTRQDKIVIETSDAKDKVKSWAEKALSNTEE